MARQLGLASAAAVGASACYAGLAFTAAPLAPPTAGPAPGLRAGTARAASGAGRAGGALAVPVAAGVLAAGLVQRRRRARVAAAAKVLTTDSAGRFRFAVELPPLVPSEQPGVTAPLGFFDPLGFTKSPLMTFPGDPNGFKHLREAEIKHGRIAMMAASGSVAAHYVQLPGFEGVPSGLAALSTPMGSAGFSALLLCVGLVEASRWASPPSVPGSYDDPFNVNQYTTDMRNKELNNGRMAMFAVMGQLLAEMQTGLDPVQQFAS